MTAHSSRRSAGRPFKPGESGNPAGRTKTTSEVKELLRSVTGEAIEKLIAIMRGKDVREARLAAEALLDRQLGKPRASVDVTATWPPMMPEGFVGGVASVLERAIADAEQAATDQQTVALLPPAGDSASDSARLPPAAGADPVPCGSSMASEGVP